jgi:hypothetical protein
MPIEILLIDYVKLVHNYTEVYFRLEESQKYILFKATCNIEDIEHVNVVGRVIFVLFKYFRH